MSAANVATKLAVYGAVGFTVCTGVGAAFGPAAAGVMGTAGNGFQMTVGAGADFLSWSADTMQNALA